MIPSDIAHHETYPDTHRDLYSKTVFGFWIYLLTDFVLFGTLFATYAVLRNNTFGGLTPHDLSQLPFILLPTLVLLVSSLTIGLGTAWAHRKNKRGALSLLGITFLLGILFMVMQWIDIAYLIGDGNDWRKSAFLSAYFTLIGTHAVHLLFALLWTLVFVYPLLHRQITHVDVRRLTCLKMFWQFLNIVWIFIFSFVYLMGRIEH
jgi:cytochrome o ubiquinol oxidase subunit III